jgi:hypothetical protein
MQGHNLEEVVAHCFQDKVDTLLGVWDQTKCTEVSPFGSFPFCYLRLFLFHLRE